MKKACGFGVWIEQSATKYQYRVYLDMEESRTANQDVCELPNFQQSQTVNLLNCSCPLVLHQWHEVTRSIRVKLELYPRILLGPRFILQYQSQTRTICILLGPGFIFTFSKPKCETPTFQQLHAAFINDRVTTLTQYFHDMSSYIYTDPMKNDHVVLEFQPNLKPAEI